MTKISYSGYRFPAEIIYQAIWLYLRFTLSYRDVEDLLAEPASISWRANSQLWMDKISNGRLGVASAHVLGR